MLQDTKRDLTTYARRLVKPYESYSIDELADAYCEALDTGNEPLKNIYISALILRFWYTIDKMYRANKVAPSLEHEDFFEWLYEAIEYACKYRGWQDPSKNLNAQQCINKCIDTIKLQKYYNLRLDKHKAVNNCGSIDEPIGENKDGSKMTLADTLVAESDTDAFVSDSGVVMLIQSYINKNKIVEAILLDNIVNNDVQKHHKTTIKTVGEDGEVYRHVEHSSEFWPYRLIQIVSKLPSTYKQSFMNRYTVSEEKLTAVLDVIEQANNQKLYRYLDRTLKELRTSQAFAF